MGPVFGLVGNVCRGAPREVHRVAIEAVAHRGPDASRRHVWSGHGVSWAFGHTRLAINDLSAAGEQPMATQDGALVMVFNGEIYNAPELRTYCEQHGRRFQSSMDGEVILHLWALEGADCLARLNGIFAVVLGDTRTGEVVLARDPLGVKPLFYSADADG